MSDRVWLVSSGHYSEYLVHCAAPSEKAAENIVRALNATDEWAEYFVEEVPVIKKADRVTVEVECNRVEWNVNPLYPERLQPVTVRWVRAPVHNGRGGRLGVYGLHQDLVRETFSDMKARLVADPVLSKSPEFKLGFAR